MWKFIKYEWRYWLLSPMTWIFLFIITMMVMGAVSSENVQIGGGVGNVHKNAPFVIQTYYGVMSLFCLLMTTAFMNASANRDFDSGMYQFVFSSPIKKRDYYFGKFIGACTIAMIPLLGVSLGSLIGPLMPWAQPERYGPVIWSGHLQGLITLGIPNTIIIAVLLYVLAIIFRSNIVSFIGAMLILVLYGVSSGFTKDIDKEWLANILDPFGFRPESIVAKYMTVSEKNAHAVPLSGAFLYNRIVWLGISGLILFSAYFRFSFSTRKEKTKKQKKAVEKAVPINMALPNYVATNANQFSFSTLWSLIHFETKSIIKNPTFIIIVVLGLVMLVTSLTSFTDSYGTAQYPVTYKIIDSVRGSFNLFLIGIITFYSGVLVWKERDAKIAEIQDATPIKTSLLFVSKLFALIISVALILSCTIFIGIIAQTLFGYHRYQLGVYIKSLLVMDLLSFAFLVVISLFFHYVINNRYIAYFSFVAFVILNQFIWGVFKVNTNMVKYGNTPNTTYSDMNGFGPFVPSAVWFNFYWFIFSILIGFVIFAFYIRGKETGFRHRLHRAKFLLGKNKLAIGFIFALFVLCSSFVYYNTKVMNKYDSEKEVESKQVDYEKTYKKYEHLIQPRFYKFDYVIDIMPYQRSVKASIQAWARNISNQPISELHFTLPQIPDSINITIDGGALKLNDNRLNYRIYTLANPLQPNDSIAIKFDVSRITKGFENEVSFLSLTQNGTFLNNMDITPILGYNKNYEIDERNKRIKLKLPKREIMPPLNENDLATRANTYFISDADWVELNTTISTAGDQIAIAPGSLVKTWTENGRNYFNYKLEQKSLDFYSFISARYEVSREKWNGIDLEVYYIKEHAYNVPNMLKSMKK